MAQHAPGPRQAAPDLLALTKRLHWLCGELAAGNAFSPEALRRWETEAHTVMRAAEGR